MKKYKSLIILLAVLVVLVVAYVVTGQLKKNRQRKKTNRNRLQCLICRISPQFSIRTEQIRCRL